MNTGEHPDRSPEPLLLGWLSLPILKTIGYIVSTISVVLLALVSWQKAKEDPLLLACLIGGSLASIIGMFCRWLSYEIKKRGR